MERQSRAFLLPYLAVVEDFLEGLLTTEELQRVYQGTFQDDNRPFDEHEYKALNEFFLDIEDYVEEPSLRGPNDFDEAELRRRAERARGEIRALLAETGDLPDAAGGPRASPNR